MTKAAVAAAVPMQEASYCRLERGLFGSRGPALARLVRIGSIVGLDQEHVTCVYLGVKRRRVASRDKSQARG